MVSCKSNQSCTTVGRLNDSSIDKQSAISGRQLQEFALVLSAFSCSRQAAHHSWTSLMQANSQPFIGCYLAAETSVQIHVLIIGEWMMYNLMSVVHFD